MAIQFYPIEDHIQKLQIIFEDMERVWKALGQKEPLTPELMKKIPLIPKEVKGIIGIEDNNPLCFAWVDMPLGRRYGNMVLHSIRAEDRILLAQKLAESRLMKGKVAELVQLIDSFEYRDTLIQMGMHEKERQRMIFEITEPYPEPEKRKNISFEPLTLENADIIGEISFLAHETRINIEGYYDFANPERRTFLTKRIRNKDLGNTVDNACFLLNFKNEPAGFCDVIELKCWSYEKVAWIMDVAVKPQFQGYGLGRYSIQKAIHEIQNSGITVVGLAVTLSNKPAVTLYESLGFKPFEYFVEFICPE